MDALDRGRANAIALLDEIDDPTPEITGARVASPRDSNPGYAVRVMY